MAFFTGVVDRLLGRQQPLPQDISFKDERSFVAQKHSCPSCHAHLEAGELESAATRELLEGFVAPLLAEGCDTLILGCTHYPFIKPLLRTLVPESISLIDTGAAVARQVQRLLAAHELLAAGPAQPTAFWSSAEPAAMQRVLPLLWDEASQVRRLP